LAVDGLAVMWLVGFALDRGEGTGCHRFWWRDSGGAAADSVWETA